MRRCRRSSSRSLNRFEHEDRKSWSEYVSKVKAIFQKNPEVRKHCKVYGDIYNVEPVEIMHWYFRGSLVEGTEIFDGIHNRLSDHNRKSRGGCT